MWVGGGEADPIMALEVSVAAFARAKRWGYWQAVEYLAEVEQRHGTRAALFELALQSAMERAEARAGREAVERASGRRR